MGRTPVTEMLVLVMVVNRSVVLTTLDCVGITVRRQRAAVLRGWKGEWSLMRLIRGGLGFWKISIIYFLIRSFLKTADSGQKDRDLLFLILDCGL